MTLYLGLTGSIGMGKSTTAAMFAAEGVPVWDADAAVHALYAPGGPAGAVLRPQFPQAVMPDGSIDRAALSRIVAGDPQALARLEALVHPLVAEDRARFIAAQDAPLLLFDIPLLFETGAEAWLDQVVVVTAPPDVQRARVLARGTMDAATFEAILARQMPDAEKRARADHVIETLSLDETRAAVRDLIDRLTAAGKD